MKLRLRKRVSSRYMARMDMTPMVDVMFSMLVLFMVTAPMITTGIPLDLPSADNRPLEEGDAALNISFNREGVIFIGEEAVEPENLVAKIRAIRGANPNVRVIISADRTVSYGQVIELMGRLRSAGYTQIGLKTDAQHWRNMSQ
ncbi:MAG: biopolymer transporter ExbD [Alphaproteobacteria bacterium]|nr:biopolymer transporter ExbD [Alphaproteobacteria bacterium]